MLVNNPCTHDSRVIKEAESLAENDWRVRVFCRTSDDKPNLVSANGVEYMRIPWLGPLAVMAPWGTPDFSETLAWEVGDEDKDSDRPMETPPAAPLERTLARQLRRILGRHLAEIYIHWEFQKSVRRSLLAFRPDVIHANDLETLPTAVSALSSSGAKIVYDSHEIALEEYTKNFLGRNLWRRRQEKRTIKKADRILSPSGGVSDYLEKRYGVDRPIVIYNSPRTKSVAASESGLRQTLSLPPETPLIVFTGKLRLDRGMVPLLRALATLEGFHLARVGPSDEELEKQIQDLAQELGITERLHLLAPVPHQQVSSFVASADLAVICNQNLSLNFDLGMPNKLFEATLAGLPLAVADLKEIRAFVEKNDLGLVMDQNDPVDIARALKAVYEGRSRFAPSGAKFEDIVETYGWEAQAAVLNDVYDALIT